MIIMGHTLWISNDGWGPSLRCDGLSGNLPNFIALEISESGLYSEVISNILLIHI